MRRCIFLAVFVTLITTGPLASEAWAKQTTTRKQAASHAVTKTPTATPQSRQRCYNRRLRQLLKAGHDYDLAQEEALLICG